MPPKPSITNREIETILGTVFIEVEWEHDPDMSLSDYDCYAQLIAGHKWPPKGSWVFALDQRQRINDVLKMGSDPEIVWRYSTSNGLKAVAEWLKSTGTTPAKAASIARKWQRGLIQFDMEASTPSQPVYRERCSLLGPVKDYRFAVFTDGEHPEDLLPSYRRYAETHGGAQPDGMHYASILEHQLENVERSIGWYNDEWHFEWMRATATLNGTEIASDSLGGIDGDDDYKRQLVDEFVEMAKTSAYKYIMAEAVPTLQKMMTLYGAMFEAMVAVLRNSDPDNDKLLPLDKVILS